MKKARFLFGMFVVTSMLVTTSPAIAQATDEGVTMEASDDGDDDEGKWGYAGLLGLLGLLGLRKKDDRHHHKN